ncbi:MAG TPA: hypothetical protein PLV85_14430, partial [Polyangiaceae bacterium]|nr:hypothetical protein [Polyangiaceae bacterium]
MTKRGALLSVPVPIAGFPPAVGRFYPQTCQSALNEDRKTLSIWMTGNGYAWTPVTQKMGFECSVAVEYKPDFHKSGDTIYVWFDAVDTPSPQFRIVHVEQAVTNVALSLYPMEWFAGQMAQSFVKEQLAKGFTVIRQDDQDDFSLGRLAVGQRPVHPWQVVGKDRFTFANETTEIRGLQQDFLGPFEIEGKDRALFLRMQVQGPPIDVFVVSKDAGYQWRMQYQTISPPTPPPADASIIQSGQTPPSGYFEGWVPVAPGAYYVVLDNSISAGSVQPPLKIPTPVDPSRAVGAKVSYLVQTGDRP